MTQRGLTVVVVTCAARGNAGLAALLRQIDDSGWTEQTLVVSDGPATIATKAVVSATPVRAGQMKNYWRALELGMHTAVARGQEHFLVLEDDVELCRNVLPYVALTEHCERFEFVSWFDGHAVPAGAADGLYACPIQSFICLQAITWPHKTAARLLQSSCAARWSEPHRGDLLVRHVLAPGLYGVQVPNLVEHRGNDSLCSPGAKLNGTRVARNYAGLGFDALTLATAG